MLLMEVMEGSMETAPSAVGGDAICSSGHVRLRVEARSRNEMVSKAE